MPTSPLIENFCQAGQGQVFAFFETLSSSEQDELLAQASEVDLAEVDHLNRTLLSSEEAEGHNFEGLEPAPFEPLPEHGGDSQKWKAAREAGEAALRMGRVAAFTVAGGQGTRLGYDGPKGTFTVTPVKAKSLFQVFAEKILASGHRFGKPLHWFIMTSHQNHVQSENFFKEHNYFGLSPEHVHFFRQGRMPAVDLEGKILLESKSSIAMSPDGHGGSLRALERSGALDLMAKEGIDTISYFQVDNPLVRCIDAEFVGWHLLSGSEMSSKTIPKAYAGEKVGHFCSQGGKILVVEYSDLPVQLQKETDPATGALRFIAGSIAIHLLDREFVRRMASGSDSLPFHRADKKIPTIDAQGNSVKPDKPNGVKFELFVFDALPFAGNPIVIETARADDFSPVKNAEGVDSPKTCRDDQLKQFARWAKQSGAVVQTDVEGLPDVTFEVSPLFGYDAPTFNDSWASLDPKPTITEGLYLD